MTTQGSSDSSKRSVAADSVPKSVPPPLSDPHGVFARGEEEDAAHQKGADPPFKEVSSAEPQARVRSAPPAPTPSTDSNDQEDFKVPLPLGFQWKEFWVKHPDFPAELTKAVIPAMVGAVFGWMVAAFFGVEFVNYPIHFGLTAPILWLVLAGIRFARVTNKGIDRRTVLRLKLIATIALVATVISLFAIAPVWGVVVVAAALAVGATLIASTAFKHIHVGRLVALVGLVLLGVAASVYVTWWNVDEKLPLLIVAGCIVVSILNFGVSALAGDRTSKRVVGWIVTSLASLGMAAGIALAAYHLTSGTSQLVEAKMLIVEDCQTKVDALIKSGEITKAGVANEKLAILKKIRARRAQEVSKAHADFLRTVGISDADIATTTVISNFSPPELVFRLFKEETSQPYGGPLFFSVVATLIWITGALLGFFLRRSRRRPAFSSSATATPVAGT